MEFPDSLVAILPGIHLVVVSGNVEPELGVPMPTLYFVLSLMTLHTESQTCYRQKSRIEIQWNTLISTVKVCLNVARHYFTH